MNLQPWPTRKVNPAAGRPGSVYDFGPLGWMTLKQAEEATGIPENRLYHRCKNGWEPSRLLDPRTFTCNGRKGDTRNFSEGKNLFQIGVMMHRNYGNKVPTPAALEVVLGCSRAHSYRLVRQYKDALGLP